MSAKFLIRCFEKHDVSLKAKDENIAINQNCENQPGKITNYSKKKIILTIEAHLWFRSNLLFTLFFSLKQTKTMLDCH